MTFIEFLLGTAYGLVAIRFFITARRRVAYRAGYDLPWVLALIWAVLWPVWTALWITAAVVLPFEKRPASLLREPSKADRAALAMDQRKAQRQREVQDWEDRVAFWYAEGQRAEAEDNQALKWLVAEQLGFLLETRPDEALTPEERDQSRAATVAKVKPREQSPRPRAITVRHYREDEPPTVEWPALRKQFDKKVRAAPTHYQATGEVGYCNVCARYHDRAALMMEGICRECSEEQGLS